MEASDMDIKTRLEKGKWMLARLTPLALHNWHVYSRVYSVHTAPLSESVCDLFKRETEHLYLRQPIHGIGRDPFRSSMRDVSDGRFYLMAFHARRQ